MPFNGSGTYVMTSLPGSWNPAATGSSATPADWNTALADLSTALSTTITKDGQTTVTANIPMATHKFTGLGDGTADTDSMAFGQRKTNTWYLYGAQMASGVGLIDFTTIPSTVNNLQLLFDLTAGTLGAQISMQFYDSLGVLDTGANYRWVLSLNNGAAITPTFANPATAIFLTNTLQTTEGVSMQVIIPNIQGVKHTQANFTGNYIDSGGAGISTLGAGVRNTNGPITGLRVLISAGTFAGPVTLYAAA